jgi:hypothetical protein
MSFIRRAASVTSAAALTIVALTAASNGVPIGLFNTGVDSLGIPLVPGSLDPHFSLVSSPPLGPDAFQVLTPVTSPIYARGLAGVAQAIDRA